MIRSSILFSCIFFIASLGHAQIVPIKIGEHVPEELVFHNMTNFHNREEAFGYFKGRPIILDFWSTGCVSCIDAMPEMEKLQQRFGDSIQILLVNCWETNAQILERVKKLKRYRPGVGFSTLPTVNGDSTWRLAFPHRSVPHHVWIDEEGIVRYITNGLNANEANIEKFLRKEPLDFLEKRDLEVYGINPWKTGIFKMIDSSLIPAGYSGFIRYSPGFGSGNAKIEDTVHQLFKRLWINLTVRGFYQYISLMSSQRDQLIIESKKKELFNRKVARDNFETFFRNNAYTYQITIPVAEKKNLEQYVLEDCNRFFRMEKQIYGVFEERLLPAWVLVLKDSSLLASKGGKPVNVHTANNDTIILNNQSFKTFSIKLFMLLEDLSRPIAFVDETNFSGAADLKLTGDLHDVENIRRQIKRYGLDLIESKRKLRVLVIKDVEPGS